MADSDASLVTDSSVLFEHREFHDHEQIVFCHDRSSGLKAIIGIHDTTLGPALGGTRMWNYASDEEALRDVLRLSRGMTYKAAISGLDLGGGKAVIIGDSKKDKSPEMIEAFGRYVDSLSGRYVTAKDVGIDSQDMIAVRRQTPHVTGIPEEMGGSGDPSPVTAFGVYQGILAAAAFRWGDDSLKDKRILVQGVGYVGETLVRHLTEAGAEVLVSDIRAEQLERMKRTYGARIVEADSVYETPMDIYAPCALGATLNDKSIAALRCSVIAGAANNQLAEEEKHGRMLMEKGITYAPDFLVNAGGLINVNSEIASYGRKEVMSRTEEIRRTTYEVLERSAREGMPAQNIAKKIAEERIHSMRSSLSGSN